MRWQVIFATVSLAACLGASTPQAGKSDQDALQGVWQVVSAESQGKAMPGGLDDLTIKGKTLRMKSGQTGADWEFKLDPSKNPKEIDMIHKIGGKLEGEVIKGIYQLTGDEFKLCIEIDQKGRPKEFKSGEKSWSFFIVARRTPKK